MITYVLERTKLTVSGVGGTQCVAIADIDPKISADLPAKEALPRQFCGGNDKILEEGEIGSSDSDGKQEVDKVCTLRHTLQVE